MTLAEPPSYRQQFQRDRQTYYVAKQQQHEPETESPEDSQSDAPYQPSGWKPDGPEFELPEKQQQSAPKQQYGAPNKVENQYGAPASPSPVQRQYGGPVRGQKQFSVSQQQYRATQKQYNTPQQQYNAPQEQNSTPQQNYGVPQQQYGSPQATTDPSTVTDYEESTTQSTATESQVSILLNYLFI